MVMNKALWLTRNNRGIFWIRLTEGKERNSRTASSFWQDSDRRWPGAAGAADERLHCLEIRPNLGRHDKGQLRRPTWEAEGASEWHRTLRRSQLIAFAAHPTRSYKVLEPGGGNVRSSELTSSSANNLITRVDITQVHEQANPMANRQKHRSIYIYKTNENKKAEIMIARNVIQINYAYPPHEHLWSLTPQPTSQCKILRLDSDTLGVDSSKIRIFK